MKTNSTTTTALNAKVKELHNLCCKANERIDQDSTFIESLNKEILQMKKSLSQCDSFVT